MLIIGNEIAGQFTVHNYGTGAQADADSLPTATFVVNGDDTAAVVTITHETISGTPTEYGVYKYSVAAADTAALLVGDRGQIRVHTVIGSVADNRIVLDDTFVLSNSEFFSAMALALGSQISVVSPNADGDVTLYANADYRSDTYLLPFTNSGSIAWPNLSSGHYDALEFTAKIGGTSQKIGTGAVVVPTAPNQKVTIAFTAAETDWLYTQYALAYGSANVLTQLNQNTASYSVFAFDGSGNRALLATGKLIVKDAPVDNVNSAYPVTPGT